MNREARERTSRGDELLLQRGAPNTELRFARIEMQRLAVLSSTEPTWRHDTRSDLRAFVYPAELERTPAVSSVQTLEPSATWSLGATLIAQDQPAPLDSAAWFSIGGTLLEQPMSTFASVTIGIITSPDSAMPLLSDVGTHAVGLFDRLAVASRVSQRETAPGTQMVPTAALTVERRSRPRTAKVHEIYVLGYPVLRQRLAAVSTVDDEVRYFVDDLFETMRAYGGVGLAANQVGDTRRIAVVDVGDDDPPPLVLINPRIVE